MPNESEAQKPCAECRHDDPTHETADPATWPEICRKCVADFSEDQWAPILTEKEKPDQELRNLYSSRSDEIKRHTLILT
jgi:hypothetical protein